MAIRHEDYLSRLPDDELKEVKQLASKLILEEATLRELREITAKSQEQLARKLKVKQSAVSKLERRTDIYISSLRGYIEALGGKLTITAELPGHFPIEINQFHSPDDE